MKALIPTLLLLCFTADIFATPYKKTLQIRFQSSNGGLDETTIYFDLGTSPAYFYPEDAPKVLSGLNGPVIYSLTSDNVACTINGYGDLSVTEVIALGVVADSDGVYVLTASELQNFDSTTIMLLEDRQQHTFTDLRTDFCQAYINTTDSAQGRFFVHVTKAVQLNTTIAGCANNDGAISINADTSFAWNLCQLYDSDNILLNTYSNINGQFIFPGLSEGTYFIKFTYNNYTALLDLSVNGTHVTVKSIDAFPKNAVVGGDINFSSATVNATSYLWDFGDGSLINGVANPTYSYYIPGDYTVKFKGSNVSGCSDSATLNMDVSLGTAISGPDSDDKGISIIMQGKTAIINMNDVPYIGASQLEVFNLLGQSVYSSMVSEPQIEVPLNRQSAGYYLVTIRNAGKINTKKIYVNTQN